MPSLSQIKQAAIDAELRERFEIAATELGLNLNDAGVKQLVWDNFTSLVSHKTTLNGTPDYTIADVYAYAAAVRAAKLQEVPPTPGSNESAVTDGMIRQILAETIGAATNPTVTGTTSDAA